MKATQNNAETEMEAAIERALQQRPQIAAAPEFAARVRSALPAQPTTKRFRSAGRKVAMLAFAVLLIAVFCLAPHTTPNFSSLNFDLEISLLAELAGVAIWLFRPQREL
jgi:hypothetical protein